MINITKRFIGFRNVSLENCPLPSTSIEMRGPPPQRDPPIPPVAEDEASTAYVTDDSQYDEPGKPLEVKEYRKGIDRPYLIGITFL